MLLLTITNAIVSPSVTPSFQRAEVLASLTSIILIALSLIIKEAKVKDKNKVVLKGEQGLIINDKINDLLKNELAWGSHLILTATAACTILIYFNEDIILRRGMITQNKFIPGPICMRSSNTGDIISLVNTKMFPGRIEFDPILENLPSILVCPIAKKGYLIVGGCSERSFTKSDEIWIEGWAKKIYSLI